MQCACLTLIFQTLSPIGNCIKQRFQQCYQVWVLTPSANLVANLLFISAYQVFVWSFHFSPVNTKHLLHIYRFIAILVQYCMFIHTCTRYVKYKLLKKSSLQKNNLDKSQKSWIVILHSNRHINQTTTLHMFKNIFYIIWVPLT